MKGMKVGGTRRKQGKGKGTTGQDSLAKLRAQQRRMKAFAAKKKSMKTMTARAKSKPSRKKKEEENECDEGDEEGEEEEPKEHDEEVEEDIPELKINNRVKDAQMNNTGGLGLCIAIVTSVAIAIQSWVRTYLHKDNSAKTKPQLAKELDAKIEKWKDDKTTSFTKDEYRSPEKKTNNCGAFGCNARHGIAPPSFNTLLV